MDGCFGTLDAHSYLFTEARKNSLDKVSLGAIHGIYKGKKVLTESLSFEKSEGNMTSIVQRKDISEPLSCGGMLWTNVVNAYGCLGSHTDTLSKWSDREILTTYNKHYFFTHSPAFSLAGYLLPNKSDLDILKRCDDSLSFLSSK